MTQGETLFYLREIHSHWGPSNVSSDKLAELAAAKLIEFDGATVPSVRLTNEGARQKALGRPQTRNGGLGLTGKEKRLSRRTPRKHLPRPRPLV